MKILIPLRLREFRILWTGMTISLIGDGVMLVAIAWQAYQLSDTPTALGLTMMAMSIPHILLLPFGGMVSDRFERRWVLFGGNFVRGLASAALAVLSVSGTLQIWHLAIIAVFHGAGNAFFGPASGALVPDLVPAKLLPQANALDQFARPVASRLVGPALGGWIIAAAGIGSAFFVDATTSMASIVCLLQLGSTVRRRREERGEKAASVGTQIREGFSFVRSRIWLWGTFVAAALAYLIFLGPAEVLLPYIVKDDIGGNAGDLGMVFAMGGLGSIAAAMIMAQRGIPRHNMTFIYLSWTLSTLAIAGCGFAQAIWQAMFACFAFNVCESAGLIVWLTTKQSLVPKRLLGRVSSLELLISTALMPMSYALAGPVAAYFGARPMLIGAGIAGSIVTLVFLYLPGMRSIENTMMRSNGAAAEGLLRS